MLYSLLRMTSKAILYLNKFHSPFLSALGTINVQWIKESVEKNPALYSDYPVYISAIPLFQERGAYVGPYCEKTGNR